MERTWVLAIAADGFPLRDGVPSFQLVLRVCNMKGLVNLRDFLWRVFAVNASEKDEVTQK